MIMHVDLINTLNDLTRINNDRAAGYDKASNQIKDPALQQVFQSMADQSRKYAFELNRLSGGLGGEEETDTTLGGELYRTWMDLKADFTSSDTSVLASCEYGEDVTLKVYNMAIASDLDIPADTLEVITRQLVELKQSHDMIKKARDQHKQQ